MFTKGKYIDLKDRDIDLLLLKLLTIYPDLILMSVATNYFS